MTDSTQNLAARYVDAIQFERKAWKALQSKPPGTRDRAEAWAVWSEAISRTNRAWRQLSVETMSRPPYRAQPATEIRPRYRGPETPPHYGSS